MKNLFKFTAAAVALFAFASCSDDISEFGGNSADFTAANELKIEAEEMGGHSLTRTAYVSESSNDRVWQETDQFTVFGPEIVGKYDYYKYKKSTNKFELDGTKDLTEAAFVAFPSDAVAHQNWKKDTGAGEITYKIPNVLEYDEVSGSSPVAYVSNLPLWGTAENDGDGIKANVYFLTSIIKVYLTNAMGNASMVRVRAWNDIEGKDPAMITGFSTVQVSKNNQALSPNEVQLATPTEGSNDPNENAWLSNEIRVDLGNLEGKAANSVVYIPLIAGYYGKVEVQWRDNGAYDVDMNDDGEVDEKDEELHWTDVREAGSYLDKTFKRATPYGNGNVYNFDINANSISGVNKILDNMKSTASGEVEVAVQTAITDIDEPLNVPAMANVTKLTLNIPAFNDATTPNTLSVEGDFAGTLVLNPTATSSLGTPVEIRTKNANVVMGGAWSNKAFKFTYAKTVQFGGLLNADDEEIAADYRGNTITLGAAVEGVIVAEKTKVDAITLPTNHKATSLDVLGTAGDITVEASTLAATTAVNVSGTAGDIAINGEKNNAVVALTGVATSIDNEGTGAITISGNPVYKANDGYKVGTVETTGDVTINLANEGAAIGTSLTFNAPATLTLTQGYVKAITVNAGEKKTVTCTLGDGYVTLPKPTLTTGLFTVSNVPAWNGEKIGGSFDDEDEVDAIKELVGEDNYVKPTDWGGYADANDAIYTPIGFAERIGTVVITLANDINLNNKPWTAVASAKSLLGNGKTISKLTVAVPGSTSPASAKDAGLGLFSKLSADVVNLTLDGVTIAAVPFGTPANAVSNIGALAGKMTADAAIFNVEVKNAKLSSTSEGGTIGGVIGTVDAERKATLSGVKASGTIEGYGNLGGLIGYVAGNATIQKIAKGTNLYGSTNAAADIISSAAVTFSSKYNNTTITNDLKYLQVGNFIGSAPKTSTLIITDAANAKPALTYDHSAYTGTTKYQVSESGTTKSYDIVFDKQTLIGWCGTETFTNAPKINGKDYQLNITKPDLNAIPLNEQYWLYYIDKE